ncbi:MAG: hypothetical protein ACRBN8_43240 [Nannocystales bacterium]
MNDDVLFRHPEPSPDALALSHELQCIEIDFDPGASFAVPVPRSMATARPTRHIPERGGRPMPIAVFGEPPSLEGPRLLVSSQTLPWEVDPLEWLRWMWMNEGWRIAWTKRHPGPNGPRYEVGALREKEGRVAVRRTMAVRSGARLMRCDASAPLPLWPGHHDALWHAINGFQLGQQTRGTIESLVVREGPLLGFAVPGSWDARGEGDETRMEWAVFLDSDAQRGAALKMHAQPLDRAPDAGLRRASLWRELKAGGVPLGAVLTAERAEFAKAVPGWIGQWQAAIGGEGRDGVVVLVQREDEGIALDVLLVAPAAGTEHVDWMRATRALDVVISTTQLRPPSVA